MGRRSWRARERGDEKNFEVLHDGVPSWLWPSLWGWFHEAVDLIRTHYSSTSAGEIVRLLERGMRTDLGSETVENHGLWELKETFRGDTDTFLDAINELLVLLGDYWATQKVEDLEFFLAHGGSLWTVSSASEPHQLVRRVDPTVQKIAEQVMLGSSKAQVHLQKAWQDIYGRHPDASDGYREAIRAVEAAAQTIVSPTDTLATLGKMIAVLKEKPSKWTTTLHHPNGAENQVIYVAGMMEAIWKGQHDRHGSGDESVPLDVSLEEAESALSIAVSLVHLFRSEAIRLSE